MRKTSRANSTFGHSGRRRPKGLAAVAAAAVVVVAAVAIAAGTSAIIKMSQPAEPEAGPVMFKHWKHQRAYKCYACHPRLFSQWDKATFDHDAMEAGKYCGACHDGKVAFIPDDADCEVCHVE